MDKLFYNEYHVGSSVESIVFLLHGYGSNSLDLLGLGKSLSNLDNTLLISPNAPITIDQDAYSWFNFVFNDNSINIVDDYIIDSSLGLLNDLVIESKKKYKVADNRISFMGFSQGGVMALLYALYNDIMFGQVIAHSSMFYFDYKSKNKFNTKQNITLLHGDQDRVIDIKYFYQTIRYLQDNQVMCLDYYLSKGLGHSINFETLKYIEQKLLKTHGF